MVRFTRVMEQSGRPQVYLLLSREDPEFKRALKAGRIMSLIGRGRGKGEYGEVGYSAEQRPQLLIFPRSLRAFAGDRIVGIKYGEFAGKTEVVSAAKKLRLPNEKKRKPFRKPSPRPVEKEAETPVPSDKVIPFPLAEEEEEDDFRIGVKQALRLLEKGKAAAAGHLLRNLLDKQG